MGIPFWLSLAVFIVVALSALDVAIGWRKIRHLKDIALPSATAQPMVSIIVSALNEADTIEPALCSLLAIDYPELEIIVIDDRSTDATPEILDRIAAQHPALHVLHIDRLPPGWLGKNHALHRGAQLAKGEFLIFTDADAVFAPDAVLRAAAYCQAQAVDHLALFFDVVARTRLLRMMLLSFGVSFMQRFRPWKVADSADHFIGIGGFNMVRTTAYHAVGGHAAIALAVIDDLMLGKLFKAHGLRQHVLSGVDLVRIEWYPGTLEMIRGLDKNMFAAFDFQLSRLIAVTPLILAVRIWPWVALVSTHGVLWWLSAATVLTSMALYVDLLRARGWSPACLIFAPLVPFIELVMFWRACLLTTLRGGVRWRGTTYALTDIRQAQAQMEAVIANASQASKRSAGQAAKTRQEGAASRDIRR